VEKNIHASLENRPFLLSVTQNGLILNHAKKSFPYGGLNPERSEGSQLVRYCAFARSQIRTQTAKREKGFFYGRINCCLSYTRV
jgi:hypothetical protein